MNTKEIRGMVAKGRLEPAIKEAVLLTKDTELANLGIGVSNGYRKYKKDSIAGIMDSNEDSKRYAVLTHQLLNLLNEYELYELKELKQNVEKLTDELRAQKEPAVETAEVQKELEEISEEMQQIEMAESKDDVKPGFLERIKTFIEKAQEPDSSYNKALKTVKNGYNILQDIASGYNSVAEWFALPQVPRLFLKKEDR
ncbi:hypothetical protein NC796_11540 [Aliifodinibius sp. S!AR15-10]|uniref:hypothetical protein n=1 Tax=Aliifodinibius sp. S!AR15-10 TaxID=2950437 RepID=UPI0028654617|nr:hypothetical protein [Aliifodinibius sp. S!AR15-10]MDR8391780.1 hypothetical protein [Aliifodinibius sp. S!AR15-10]